MRSISTLIILILTISPLFSKTIYLAKDGSDSNPGSINAPFGSVAKATSQLFAGDTLFIREGRYTETLQMARSGSSGNPIVIMAYPGERVVLSALEPLSGWEQDAGSVYKTSVGWDLGQGNFVMYGDTACDLARWPNNTDGDLFSLNSLRNSGGSGPNVVYNAYLDYIAGFPDFDWSKGGSVFFYGDKGGAGWIAWKCFIKSNTTTRLTFDLVKSPDWIRTWHSPEDLGDFYLEGIREALDYKKEWFFDENSKVLYIQLPGGTKPEDNEVYMRKRTYTIKLSSFDYIVVKNLEVLGGSIEVKGDNNYLYGIKSRWGNHHRGIISQGFSAGTQSLLLSGSNNIVEKCDLGYGAASGVKLSGSRNQLVNSYIHNFNFLGSYDAPVMARDGNASILKNCTVTRGGRDAVHMSNDNSVMSYNDVSRSNMIADDCALFYCTAGPHNITIHHNWFHDTWGRGKLKKAAGIYLDSSPKGFTVHHNVIWNTEWSSIQMNKDARDIDIYNNTLWDGSTAIGYWHAAGTHFERVVVYNNLANNHGWDSQNDYQNNLTVSSNPFVNSSAKNWQLKPGTAPVDYGRKISGYTDGFIGDNPDAGAYEYGAAAWTAGIDWDPELGPDVCLENDIYEEVDGLLIIEAESAASTGKGWKYGNELPSLGSGYMEYTGDEQATMPVDSTVSTYKIKISNPGIYRFMWLAGNGSSWLNIECDEFYGMHKESRQSIDTAFAALSLSGQDEWSWESEAEFMEADSMKLYASFTYSGIYTISVAGRHSGHLIDRLVLFQEGRESVVTDESSRESWTGCDEYSPANPWASAIQASVKYHPDELIIDGIIDGDWERQNEYTISQNLNQDHSPSPEELSASYRLSFNDSALYILVQVEDDFLSAEDHMDLYLNPDNSHQSLGAYGKDAIHMRFDYGTENVLVIGNGSWKAEDTSGFEYTTETTDSGYLLEARIPWKGIYPIVFESVSNTYMGFEISINDPDQDPGIENKLAWANNTGIDLALYDTRKFGSLVLKKNMEVLPVDVSGVELPWDTLVIQPGEIVRLEANVLPENADNKTVTWWVEDNSVLDLAPSTGVAKGRYPGTTRIFVTTQEDGFVDSCILVVPDPNATTGLDEDRWNENLEISLVPNPATESFRIKGAISWTEIEIYAVNGKRVIHIDHTDHQEYISLNQLPSGLYLVRIHDGDKVYQRKLVKARD